MSNAYVAHLGRLTRHGQALRQQLQQDSHDRSTLAEVRIWQQDCAAIVQQLSGGSKAHWLSRGYSDALLVRAADGRTVTEANVGDIVERIVDLLARAMTAISSVNAAEPADTSASLQSDRRFDFVHNAQLRPVVQRAYADSRDAFDRGDFRQSLVLTCSVLEALITDALAHLEDTGRLVPDERIGNSPFDARIKAAEDAGLIRGGCARLPRIARTYREHTDAEGELRPEAGISEQDARVTAQVLRIVMRDLDPGR